MACCSFKGYSTRRKKKLFAVLLIAFFVTAVEAGKGRGRKSAPGADDKSRSRKKDKSRKGRSGSRSLFPSSAPSITGSESPSLSPSSTIALASSNPIFLAEAPNRPAEYPSQHPSESPVFGNINEISRVPTLNAINPISVALPRMQIDISTFPTVEKIDQVGFHQVFHSFLTDYFASGSLSDEFDYLELGMWSTNATQLTFIGDIYLSTKDNSDNEENIKAKLVTLFSFWGNESFMLELRKAGIPVSKMDMYIDGVLVVTNNGLLGIKDGDEMSGKSARKHSVFIPTVVLAVTFSMVAVIMILSRSKRCKNGDTSTEMSTAGATVVVRIGRNSSMYPGSHHESNSFDGNCSHSTNYDSVPVYRFEESAYETDSMLLDTVIRSPVSSWYDPRRLDRVISKARMSTSLG